LDALEKEEDRAERGINDPQVVLNENDQAIKEQNIGVATYNMHGPTTFWAY
jgi:hypothetical protein